MRQRTAAPVAPSASVGDLQEVFEHPYFVGADHETRKAVMLASAQSKYEGELRYPWDQYFEIPITTLLRGKDVLDLGCFTGGRTVAWNERYDFRSITGVDVLPVYMEAASLFASSRACAARFRVGFAEALPFVDEAFDAIVTFDVLEHVRDVARTLAECYRVLRAGGVLICVFPSYFQPNEHHLGLVTRFPGLQLLFSGATLVEAYSKEIEERGAPAAWYRRASSHLAEWERGNTLNGITFREFKRLIGKQDWVPSHISRKPIGSVGRNVAKIRGLGAIAQPLRPLTYVPGLQEVLLHRIAVVLRKPRRSGDA
jgi:SAM-dependent methyltransferase